MKTAVEWLEGKIIDTDLDNLSLEWLFKHIKKAKKIEKEQIINARNEIIFDLCTKDGEQYYNETFKSE